MRQRTNLIDSREVARRRDELRLEPLSEAHPVKRQRVEEFAKDWMASKLVSVDAGTARTYAKALEHHVLPTLGTYWYDALRKADVQRWVDRALRAEWTTPSGVKRRYSRAAVHGWFRVFRTMTKDATDTFELPRDPCARIRFPQEELSDGSNALTPTELAAFLGEMHASYPHHYALVMVLAFTGLRFCHASALAWEDWDEANGLLRIRRKHVRGVVSSLTRKKRALELSDDERGELIGQLLRSLEPADGEDLTADEWLAAWSGELDQRAREVHDGAVELIDGDEALAGVRRSITARRP